MKLTMIAGVVALLLGSLNLVQCAQRSATNTKLQAMTDQRDALLTAAGACTSFGVQVTERLNACIRFSETSAESERAALAQRDAATTERDAAMAAARERRRSLYATDSTCAAWAAAPVCPAVSDQLRAQWADRTRAAADRRGKAGADHGAGKPDRQP